MEVANRAVQISGNQHQDKLCWLHEEGMFLPLISPLGIRGVEKYLLLQPQFMYLGLARKFLNISQVGSSQATGYSEVSIFYFALIYNVYSYNLHIMSPHLNQGCRNCA